MIDDRSVIAAPRARLDARTARSFAARRRIPTCSSRRARPCNPFYLGVLRPSCRTRWTVLRRRPARNTAVRLVGAPDAERVIILMGSGAGAAEEAVGRILRSKAKRSACSKSGSSGRSPPRPSSRRCQRRVKLDRGARSHQGAGGARRAAVPGCGDRCSPRALPAAHRLSSIAESYRRPLRAFVEGIHAGDGQGASSTN